MARFISALSFVSVKGHHYNLQTSYTEITVSSKPQQQRNNTEKRSKLLQYPHERENLGEKLVNYPVSYETTEEVVLVSPTPSAITKALLYFSIYETKQLSVIQERQHLYQSQSHQFLIWQVVRDNTVFQLRINFSLPLHINRKKKTPKHFKQQRGKREEPNTTTDLNRLHKICI